MRWSSALALLALAALAATPAVAGEVRLSLGAGRVSLVATDATVAEIVAEWARLGRVRVVNVETLPRERMSIQLEDVTEEQALRVLLRRAGGYIAAPRPVAQADASMFDRLVIMAPSANRPDAVRAAVAGPEANAAEAGAEEAGADEEAATQASGQAADTEATADPARPDRREFDGVPVSRARAYLAATTDPNQRLEAAPDGQAPSTVLQSFTNPGVRPAPLSRPMTAGQLAARRASEGGASASPRDRVRTQVPPDPAAADEASRLEEVAPPSAVTPLPIDPIAQATFKSRQAVEIANPRDFNFPRPQPPVAVPGGAGPVPGARTPGTPVPPVKPPGSPGHLETTRVSVLPPFVFTRLRRQALASE